METIGHKIQDNRDPQLTLMDPSLSLGAGGEGEREGESEGNGEGLVLRTGSIRIEINQVDRLITSLIILLRVIRRFRSVYIICSFDVNTY